LLLGCVVKRHRAEIWVLSALASLGCSVRSSPSDHGGSQGLGLQVASGATLSSAGYTIEGPSDFLSAGSVPVGASPDVPVTISHLPLGAGYLLRIDATASDDLTVCSGSASFDVTDASAVFTVVVHLDCAVPSGDLSLSGVLNVCPILDGIDAVPMDVKLGGASQLTLFAHDTDTGPSPLSYAWAVNGIKLARQTSPTLGFTCTSAGEVTISGTVSDGDPDPACADSSAVKVTCQ
jgi:hypothetical protein